MTASHNSGSEPEQSGRTPLEVYRSAIDLWRAGDWGKALALLENVLDGRYGGYSKGFARRLFVRLLGYAPSAGWPEAERLSRRAIELLPGDAIGYRHLGEALFRLDRLAEAEKVLEDAVRLDPEGDEARMLMMLVRRGPPQARGSGRLRTWPDRQPLFDDLPRLLERYLFRGYPNEPFIQDDTAFMTLGSCFADNLGRRLARIGYTVHSEPIGEEVNSTYANLHLLRWIESGAIDGPTGVIDEVYGPDRRERLLCALQQSQVLVLTLGVSPCLFDRQTGEFAFANLQSVTGREYVANECVMRTTTVAENVDNIKRMLEIVERVGGLRLKVVLTVSPVSLGASPEHYSAIIADCLSKSTLRLACDSVIQERSDIVYWPSFEIVRWLGAHFTRPEAPAFGGDDGNTRHVSTWLVDLIIELFLAHHSAPDTLRRPVGVAESGELDLGLPKRMLARLDSFEAEVWADAAELAKAYAEMDEEAQRQVFVRAAEIGDLKRIATSGRGLFAREVLHRPWIFLFGRALAAQGCWTKAAEAFDHPKVRNRHSNSKYVRARALALAAGGCAAGAVEAIDEAVESNPRLGLEALRQILADIAELEAREGELDNWPEARRLASAWIQAGFPERAGPLLSRIRSNLGQDELVDWASLALEACPADEVLTALKRMTGAARFTPQRRTLTAAAAALSTYPSPPPAKLANEPGSRFWRAIAHERRGDLDAAVTDLCGLAAAFPLELEIRRALARCVGKSVLNEVRPAFAPGGTGKIINIVPFFNELDMLRLHLEEMAPWVDRFVITEGVRTFTGNPKPLIFEENRQLFADFEDKITHVPIRAFPEHMTSPWAREFYQRDMGIAGASGLCGAEDYILESDVDEIIEGRALEGLEADFAALDLRLARYFLNYCPGPDNPERTHPKASIFKAKHLQRHGLSYGRFYLAYRYRDAQLIKNAGWHFTSTFDAEGISLKLNSYAHQEPGKAIYRSIPHFEALRGRLKAGELDPGWERVELDESFPRSLLGNLGAFAEVIL